jgi:hypothetical protein
MNLDFWIEPVRPGITVTERVAHHIQLMNKTAWKLFVDSNRGLIQQTTNMSKHISIQQSVMLLVTMDEIT